MTNTPATLNAAINGGAEIEVIVRRGDWTFRVNQEGQDDELPSFDELADAVLATASTAASFLRDRERVITNPPPF